MITGQEARELTRKSLENAEKRLEEERIEAIIRCAAEKGQHSTEFCTDFPGILCNLTGFKWHAEWVGSGNRHKVQISW